MSAEVLHGDCRALMAVMEAGSVDAIVCDPPYGLTANKKGGSGAASLNLDSPAGRHRITTGGGFMGQKWDSAVPPVEVWAAALLVAKPGARLLAFGGTRTYHRMASAIEDAGWEIEDCLAWIFGSGFPKHASKLKPAHEPIVMARKPAPRATLLNIDACRIQYNGVPSHQHFDGTTRERGTSIFGNKTLLVPPHAAGRWPANVLLDEEAATMLDAQSGELTSGANPTRRGSPKTRNAYGGFEGQRECVAHRGVDTGGASRFFYCAKASRSEREAGLAALEQRAGGSNAKGFTDDVERGHDRNRPVANHHPTVKPVALMRWLVRLVTPDGGLVLDPFAGSGTTGIAAVLEGRQFIGCEQSAEYVAIARARIAHHANQLTLDAA